jgi:hypothetical protein
MSKEILLLEWLDFVQKIHQRTRLSDEDAALLEWLEERTKQLVGEETDPTPPPDDYCI